MTDAEQAVLAWCNEKRLEWGRSPRAEISKGYHICKSCPVARTLGFGFEVSKTNWYYGQPYDTTTEGALPDYVYRFVRDFDAGEYPQYDSTL